MNKIEYSINKTIYFLGVKLFTIKDNYTERSYENIENDLPPIVISENYAKEEFK